MLIIAIIMSGLALLAATVCLILLIQEKKRNQKRNAALIDYVDNTIVEEKKAIAFNLREEIYAECKKLCNRIENLEKGIVPDFEEAKQAARAVDDFNKGLSNILGFDPMESLQRERQKAQMGGEEI
jgi:signal transduction histidine kinase